MRSTLYLLWCFHRRLSRRPAQAGIIMSRRADAEWPGTMSNHCKFTCFFFFSLTHRAFLIYCTPRQWRSRDFVIHSQRLSYQAVAQSGIHFTYLRCTVTLFGLLTFWSRGYFLKLNAKMWDNFLRLSMWFLLSQFVNVLWFMLTLLPLEVNHQCLNKVREASFTGLRLSCITSVDSFQILSTLSCSRFYTSC